LEPWGEEINDVRASWAALVHCQLKGKKNPFTTRPEEINKKDKPNPNWWSQFSSDIKSQHEAIQANKTKRK